MNYLYKIYFFHQDHKKQIFKIIFLILILLSLLLILTSCGSHTIEETNQIQTNNSIAQQELQKAMDIIAQQNAVIQKKEEMLKKQEEIAKQHKELAEVSKQKLFMEQQKAMLKEQKHQATLESLKKFKKDKDILQEKLNSLINQTQKIALKEVLKNNEFGTPGIYLITNTTNNKVYIGQAKQCIKRIKEHFKIEDLTKDFINGDNFVVQILPSGSLPGDYEINHIEKAAIEMFKKTNHVYNKTEGNVSAFSHEVLNNHKIIH